MDGAVQVPVLLLALYWQRGQVTVFCWVRFCCRRPCCCGVVCNLSRDTCSLLAWLAVPVFVCPKMMTVTAGCVRRLLVWHFDV